MHKAPIISTIIAIGLFPIALLYIHAFISALKKKNSHHITGTVAILGDLLISLTFMIYRSFGGKIGDNSIHLAGYILLYFIIHGIVSMAVIALEITMIVNAIYFYKNKKMNRYHRNLGRILFIIWWAAFISGEVFYIVNYIR
jgi:hypothetical protein